jgi:hypothetical protein
MAETDPDAGEDLKSTEVDHSTLRYSLLGPSLLKSGQDDVDQQKVSEIIYNASKGSKYFHNEEVRDKSLTQKIDRILSKKAQLEKLDLVGDIWGANPSYFDFSSLGRKKERSVAETQMC